MRECQRRSGDRLPPVRECQRRSGERLPPVRECQRRSGDRIPPGLPPGFRRFRLAHGRRAARLRHRTRLRSVARPPHGLSPHDGRRVVPGAVRAPGGGEGACRFRRPRLLRLRRRDGLPARLGERPLRRRLVLWLHALPRRSHALSRPRRRKRPCRPHLQSAAVEPLVHRRRPLPRVPPRRRTRRPRRLRLRRDRDPRSHPRPRHGPRDVGDVAFRQAGADFDRRKPAPLGR